MQYRTRIQPQRLLLALAAAAALPGCAVNPLVDVPDRSTEGEVTTMPSALTRARHLKEGYHRKAYEFVDKQVALNDALLGLGVLTIGLGASHGVHPDAFRSTAFLGGATFLFGQQNTSKSRLDIYQSGIGSVNCALTASLPLQVGNAELASIAEESKATKKVLPAFGASLANAEAEFAVARESLLPSAVPLIEDQINGARLARAAALAALADAGGLPAQVGTVAKQLRVTLDVIEVQVNKKLGSTVADPAAVQQSLTSLATLAGRTAPGLGVDKFFTPTSADAATAQAGSDGSDGGAALPAKRAVRPSNTLTAALRNLAMKRAELEAEAVPLAQRLLPYKGHTEASAIALKACDVVSVSSALAVDQDELRFSAAAIDAQTKTLVISGGVKPYVVRLRESPTLGIEAQSPVSGDSAVLVKVPKGIAAGTALTMIVSDAATPAQTKAVRIVVGAPKAAVDNKPDDLGQIETAAKALIDAKTTDFKVKGGVNTYTLLEVKPNGENLDLKLSCKPGKPAKKDSSAAIAKGFLTRAFPNDPTRADPGIVVTGRLTPMGDIVACSAG